MGNLKSGISSQLVQCLYTALTAEVDRSCVSIMSLKGLYKVSIRVGVLFAVLQSPSRSHSLTAQLAWLLHNKLTPECQS